MVTVNDRIQKKGVHYKYLINVDPDKNVDITFRVVQGSCLVEVLDANNVITNQTMDSQQVDYKDISLKAEELPADDPSEESQPSDNQNNMNDMNIPPVYASSSHKTSKHKVLRHLHIKVTSLSDKPIDYLISYSQGKSGLFLQDGLVMKKQMVPDISHSFFYHNKNKESHAYLTLSSNVIPDYGPQYSKNEY